jgi:hypothetical protein
MPIFMTFAWTVGSVTGQFVCSLIIFIFAGCGPVWIAIAVWSILRGVSLSERKVVDKGSRVVGICW